MRRLFYNGRILAEEGPFARGYVVTAGKSILDVGEGVYSGPTGTPETLDVVNLEGRWLAPGFIDGHVHGGGGADFMDGTVEAFVTAAQLHLSHGTTTICPTSMACGDDALFAFLDAFNEAKELKKNMPHLHGVHLEGPYFSPAQAGAQPPEFMKKPFPDHCLRVLERGKGSIVRWSSAPEVEGVLELGDECVRRGILPSIAHTDADYDLICRAMEHGYRHLTHFYSGMSLLRRRNGYRILGAVEAGYLLDELHIELIADGVHLPPELLRLILKCKDHDHITLITDAMRAAGMPEGPSVLGRWEGQTASSRGPEGSAALCRSALSERGTVASRRLGGQPVIVEGGVAKMPDRKSFAGSVATTDRLVRVMVREAGLSLWEAVRMVSLNPARRLGIDGQTGSIALGKAADLVILDQELNVCGVYVDGEPIQ